MQKHRQFDILVYRTYIENAVMTWNIRRIQICIL